MNFSCFYAKLFYFAILLFGCFDAQAKEIPSSTYETHSNGQKSSVSFKFDFGDPDYLANNFICVSPDTEYSQGKGYGFNSPVTCSSVSGVTDPLTKDFCTSQPAEDPFMFSVDVPEEGNYRVTVTVASQTKPKMFIKAESRRLMLENISVDNSTLSKQFSFIVNIRNSQIKEGRSVRLKSREKLPTCYHWDNTLTLEFCGQSPNICAMEIEKADDVPTIFLCGDSTVTDQTLEPWTSWGQMLTCFFKPDIAVANYAESGLTLDAFKGQRRLEKIQTQIKPGDYMFVQFAHNDMKRGTPEEIGYLKELREFIKVAKEAGAYPVMVTSMHRRRFDSDGKVVDTMQGFPEAMKSVAAEQGVPLIDLHTMSRTFYEAMGPEESARAFVDGTHHNAYGAYELSKCIIEGIRSEVPKLAEHIIDELPTYNPAQPDPVDDFYVPASKATSEVKPEGS